MIFLQAFAIAALTAFLLVIIPSGAFGIFEKKEHYGWIIIVGMFWGVPVFVITFVAVILIFFASQ